MKQDTLFDDIPEQDPKEIAIGAGLFLKFNEVNSNKVFLYKLNTLIKMVDLSDRVAKKLLIIEVVAMGAIQTRLAKALRISRQTIHNYIETQKQFGLTGLIGNYPPSKSQSQHTQPKEDAKKLETGNRARQLEQIRREQKQMLPAQEQFSFGEGIGGIEPEDQPYAEEHDWKQTRYAGVFVYLITLIAQNQWLRLIMEAFGEGYKIFMVFVLMVAHNIRSIEQLKNVHRREAGIILGIKKLPIRLSARKWLHEASRKKISSKLLKHFFYSQITNGIVGIWLWFTDGHHLPYTGKGKVHSGYNTQRQIPEPARTNMVTTDSSGRIVDFDIQEGKGDLRGYIVELAIKWRAELPHTPVMIFDREGYGAAFFYNLVNEQVPFVTWDKHIDTKKLQAINDERFEQEFEFNGKIYRVFEDEKAFTHKFEDGSCKEIILRRIYIWNVTCGRRTCALGSINSDLMDTQDCARAILNRWGASENTFKHLGERHPQSYQPGFEFVESENQEIANPEYKEKKNLLAQMKRQLSKLYKKFVKSKEVFNKDGSPRENSARERLKREIFEQETEFSRVQQESKQTPERIDISNLEDYRNFQKISNESKNLFDFVTSGVWNARKQMVEWLLPFYQNKNEYIDLFYAITYCHGWVKSEKHTVTVRLEPLQQPTRRAAQEQFCRKLSSLKTITPAGKALVIEVGSSPLR